MTALCFGCHLLIAWVELPSPQVATALFPFNLLHMCVHSALSQDSRTLCPVPVTLRLWPMTSVWASPMMLPEQTSPIIHTRVFTISVHHLDTSPSSPGDFCRVLGSSHADQVPVANSQSWTPCCPWTHGSPFPFTVKCSFPNALPRETHCHPSSICLTITPHLQPFPPLGCL